MAVKFLNGIDVDGSMNIAASDVPNLDASKITSGTLSADRIPNLSGTYQPAGDYLTLETAETSFQPIGNYLTSVPAEYLTQTEGDARYLQSLPSHNHDGRYLRTGVTLGSFTEVDAIEDDRVVGLTNYTGAPYANHNIVATFINHASGGRRAQLFFGDTPNAGAWFRLRQGTGVQHDWYKLWNSFDFTSTNISNWNTAYGWGNHASAGYLTSLPSHNHDTLYDTLGSAAAVNDRIDAEVLPQVTDNATGIDNNRDEITSLGTALNGKLSTSGGTLYKQTDTTGTSGTTFLTVHNNVGGDISQQQSFVDFMFTDTNANFTPQVRIGAQVGRNADANAISKEGAGAFVVYTGNGTDESGNGALSEAMRIGWDNKLIVQGEIQASGYNKTSWDTAFSWGDHASAGYLTSIPSTYATDAEVSTAVGTVDARINEEIIPYVDAVAADAAKGVTAYSWGNHASAGYLTSLPNNAATFTNNIYLSNSATTADFITELTNLGAFQDNYKAFKVAWSYAGNSNLDVGFESVELAGCLIECWGGTYKHVRLTRPTTGTGGRSIYVYNDQGSNYAPGWRQIWTSDEFSSADISNYETAYSWGNHATAGYASTGYVDTAVSNLVDAAPGALNTLNELAAALGDDANFSTTVTNNIAAVDTRINDEVIPYVDAVAADASKGVTAYSWGNHAGLYLGATAKAADSNLLDGIDSSAFLRSNTADTATGALTFAGSTRFEGNIGNSSATGPAVLVGLSAGNDPQIQLQGTSTDASPHIDFSNGVGEDFDARIILTGNDTLDISGANLTIGGQTAATQSWVTSQGYLTSIPSTYATDAEVNTAVGAIDTRINDEVIPYIGDVENTANTAYGWGNHASAGYLTSVPSTLSVTSIAVGSGATLTESTDRADLLMIKSSTSTWGGLQIANTSNEVIFSLMGDNNTLGLYDDLNNDWILQRDENGATRLYHNAGSKLSTTSTGISVTGEITTTGGNSTNWNTAYGWGDHSTVGYVRNGTDIVSGNIHPVGDREQLLGLEENRWQIVFCEILDSAGQHEKNLQNPEGEKSVGDYPTGTVLVWKGGKNIPCTEAADHMRMGIAVEGVASPLIQGAEPVLVTGKVNEGDYLVTSSKEGHAEAVSPEFMRQHGLYDCVLGKALESGEGESYLLKTWINI